MGTVPEVRLDAFKFVKFAAGKFVKLAPLIAGKVPVRLAAGRLVRDAPEPLKVVAVTIPPEAVIPVPTFNTDVVVIPDTLR